MRSLLTLGVALLGPLSLVANAIQLPIPPKKCKLPAHDQPFETATPAEVYLDPVAVTEAVLYANLHNRISLQIFRHNCLVATGLEDFITDSIPNNVWSVTKSVVSLLTGIAQSQGKLKITDRIGQYLPQEKGWGNRTHRRLTIEQLLTETSGFTEAIIAEAATVLLDQSIAQEALAQPFKHKPGTFFEYSQRVPDLLAYVVERAVGEPLQDFAQKYLFAPIGIHTHSYVWLKDRSGETYGYAWLFIAPRELARIGLLAQNMGNWNGQQVVPTSWMESVKLSSKHNPCYGQLFWTNRNKPCTGANIPAAETFPRYAIPAAPRDLFAMVGALQQNNFMIPSLDMTVTWTGFFGDEGDINLSSILSASPSTLYNNFFAILIPGVLDKKVRVPQKGDLPPDGLDLDINPFNYVDPRVLLHDVLASPSCNILFCNGTIPTKGLYENLQAIARLFISKIP